MITLNKVLISLVHLKTNVTGVDLHINLPFHVKNLGLHSFVMLIYEVSASE